MIGDEHVIFVRVPAYLAKALEDRVRSEQRAKPHEKVTRSSVTRRIMHEALVGDEKGKK